MIDNKSASEEELIDVLYKGYRADRVPNNIRNYFLRHGVENTRTISLNEFDSKIKPLLETDRDTPGAPGIVISELVNNFFVIHRSCVFQLKNTSMWYAMYQIEYNDDYYYCDKYSSLKVAIAFFLERHRPLEIIF
jgi:hypothetical protein